jgi:CRISPR/Cas system CSM-associated protein Csm3 (group 7 of RAMP superfamily)
MHLTMTPQGPWMVRGETREEGQARRDILYPLLDHQGRPLLPASSLKGVLRSTVERILRTVDTHTDPKRIPLADDPFVHKDADYHQYERATIADSELAEWNEKHKRYTQEQLTPERIYRVLSAASQMFGCTLHAGLVMLDDATVPARRLSPRTHVAIDRFTGGVGEGPFNEQLVVEQSLLTTHLTITNFALWQIGLLALVFQEINRGYVGMGAGTRKGQGQMKIAIPVITFTYNAQAYRDSQKGIISAQARLAEPPWSVNDVPYAVQHTEGDKVLLSDIDPQTSQDWREEGMKVLLVQEEQVTALFQEAVQHAWVPWVQQMMKQEVQ